MTDEGTMFVQPLPDHLVHSDRNLFNHTHMVYKRTTQQAGSERVECAVEGTTGRWLSATCNFKCLSLVNSSSGHTSTMKYDKTRKVGKDIPARRFRKGTGHGLDSSGSKLGGRYVIEALVVGDVDLYRKHGYNTNQVKRYIITMMNIVCAYDMKNYRCI